MLQQLVDSKAWVNFNQGLDIRLTNEENIELINQVKIKQIHFAWDNAEDDLKPYFERYKALAKHKPHGHYGMVYCLTNFGSTADKVIKGGTGYGLDNTLPYEIEHIYPDYALYPDLTEDIAYGFLTRGCPRGCKFCIVAEKEGRRSYKVADLHEFWRGQKHIELLDPNILACTVCRYAPSI